MKSSKEHKSFFTRLIFTHRVFHKWISILFLFSLSISSMKHICLLLLHSWEWKIGDAFNEVQMMPLIKDYRCLFGLVFYHYFPFKMNPGWWCPNGSSFYFYEWGSGWLFYFHAKWIQDEAVDHFPFYILFSGFPPIKGLFIWFSTIKDSSNDKAIPIQEKSDSEALSCTSLLLDYFYKIWIILLSSLILDSSWEKIKVTALRY